MRGLSLQYKQLGQLMRDARLKKHLSLESAILLLGISHETFLCNSESGRVNFPTTKLKRACEIYGLSHEDVKAAMLEDYQNALTGFLKEKR